VAHSHEVALTADLRLLARFDGQAGPWRTAAGTYMVALGKNALDLVLTAETPVKVGCFGK
jgi:hypothetical protein